jgi:hypothetical protein
MSALSTSELKTLEAVADPAFTDGISRSHLEKLSRLDLIEPCPQGVCMTLKGKEILFGKNSRTK